MKYIIEIKPEYEGTTKGIIVLGIKNNCLCVDELAISELEELNSDYINEHFGSLQDTAYKKGLHDGESKCGYCNEYQRGLDDAWEAARKIIHMPEGKLLNIFTECYSAVCTALQVLLKYDASEAIEKLKDYEEKHKTDDEIKVGDEVKHKEYKNRFVVTKMQNEHIYGISKDGSWNNFGNDGSFVKTGRHFDIEKILEAMRHN